MVTRPAGLSWNTPEIDLPRSNMSHPEDPDPDPASNHYLLDTTFWVIFGILVFWGEGLLSESMTGSPGKNDLNSFYW